MCAEDIKNSVFLFEVNYLRANDIKATNDKLEQYYENRYIDDKVTAIEKVIKSSYSSFLDKKKRKDMQK